MCNASGLYNSNIGNGNVEEHNLGINSWAYGLIIFSIAGFFSTIIIS